METNMAKKDIVDILKVSVILAICFIISVYLLPDRALANINPYTYIPTKAYTYCPLVKTQQEQYFKLVPIPYYFGGLIEQESCISLTNSKCWNPYVELNTSREYGVGLGEISKAYDKNGKVRFDSLADMVKLHNKELHELSWSNVKQRPDLQIRTMILMSEDNYKALYNIKDPIARMEFTDSAYNTGLGGVYRSRRLCGLTKGCDAQAWFNNGVSSTCDIGHKVLYGNRTACDINLDHVSNIFKIRMNKYKVFFINKE